MQFFVVNAPLPSTPTPNNIKCVLVTRLQLLSRDVDYINNKLRWQRLPQQNAAVGIRALLFSIGYFLRLFLSLCVEGKVVVRLQINLIIVYTVINNHRIYVFMKICLLVYQLLTIFFSFSFFFKKIYWLFSPEVVFFTLNQNVIEIK